MAEQYGDLAAYQGLSFAARKRPSSDEISTNIAKFQAYDNDFCALPDMRPLEKAIKKRRRLAKKEALNDGSDLEETSGSDSSESDLDTEDDDDDGDIGLGFDNDQENDASGAENAVGEPMNLADQEPNKTIRDNFYKYTVKGKEKFGSLSENHVRAIQLLTRLRKTRAPLESYESIMGWHLQELDEVTNSGLVSGCKEAFIPRKKLFSDLRQRYNMPEKMYSQTTTITLPSSNSRSDIIHNDAQAVFQQLLTDPRIQAKDYLFYGDNPFNPPPARLTYIEGLNTGLCMRETWHKLITKPGKQVLLPCIWYYDGAATCQFSDRPITAVRLALGIFSMKAREKDFFWGTLGYLPQIRQPESDGRRMLLQSGHHDGYMMHQEYLANEANQGNQKVHKAQDLHVQLNVILKSFLKLQKTGFIWDLYYNGKVWKDVEFVIFTPFLKLDSAEADKACGKYGSRTQGVAHLCRYCHCPTKNSDDHMADFPYKTAAEIQALVEAGDLETLRKISQNYIRNAWHDVRFGQHNGRGVHGATPMEMLHAILLGVFLYVRNMFFEQIGLSSRTGREINALSKEYGNLLTRQSDRDFPKTKFGKGIKGGKLTAKEYRGILLNMSAVLRSTAGRSILRAKKITTKTNPTDFNKKGVLDDWILLCETLLEWEQWLKSPKMKTKHVRALVQKNRYIMYLVKKIGNRQAGMGLNTLKFHAILHMADDIMQYGVPMEYDTGFMEQGHIRTKSAALLTQKKAEVFDFQTSIRKEEMDLLDLAQEEISGRKKWEYYEGHYFPDDAPPKVESPTTGGGQIECYRDQNGVISFEFITKFKGMDGSVLETELIEFVVSLSEKLGNLCPKNLVIRTLHKRNGVLFHANAKLQGSLWRDWAIVDWGDDGELPNRIWGFLDLSVLPPNSGLSHGGIDNIQPGIYAIVESAAYIEDEKEINRSNIFVPVRKEVDVMEHGNVVRAKLYLADVEAIVAPVSVIPDIGGLPHDYFVVKNASQWRDNFIDWLESDPVHDVMEPMGE